MIKKDYVLVDPSSAIIISAFLQERPFKRVTVDEIDPEESRIMADGLEEEDFDLIDIVITAAGTTDSSQDGNYTPEERSALAKGQPRDASGQFAKAGKGTVWPARAVKRNDRQMAVRARPHGSRARCKGQP
jgi:hypothetical protein